METIIRPAKSNEYEKINRILHRAGFKNVNVMPATYVITIPNPSGEKRWIVGVVMFSGERLCYLAVEPQHRHKGYAKKLIEKVLKDFDNNVSLCVRVYNWSAIRLYWKMGFKITGLFRGRSFEMQHRLKIKKRTEFKQENHKSIGKFVRNRDEITLWKYLLTRKENKIKENNKYFYLRTSDHIRDIFDINRIYKGKFESKISYKEVENMLYDIASGQEYYKAYDLPDSKLQKVNFNSYFMKLMEADNKWSLPLDENNRSWLSRFESHLYNEFKMKLTAPTKSYIGKVIKEVSGDSYVFQIVNKVDWKAGDFGDRYSCWFDKEQYKWMRDNLFNSGHGFAVKFYKPDEYLKGNLRGLGRCWMSVEE